MAASSPERAAVRATHSEGTVMSSYPYPPDPGTGSGAGTGISGDDLSVTDPGTAYSTSGSIATGPTTSSTSSSSTTEVAKEQAGEVMDEARGQARTLLDRTRSEMGSQAASQQNRAAESLRSLSGELRSMADSRQEPGMATDLTQQAADKAGQLASWLQDREPGDLLDEVSSFARRRPGAFLALAAGAGVIAGRLTRSMAAGAPSRQDRSYRAAWTSGRHFADTDTTSTRPFTRATPGYPATDPLGTTGTGVDETVTGLRNDVTR